MDQIRKTKAHDGDVYAISIVLDDQKKFNSMVSAGDHCLHLWNTEVTCQF
jgi:hypothetical protein